MIRTQSGIQHLSWAISLLICSCNQRVYQCSCPYLAMCPWRREDGWDCNLIKEIKNHTADYLWTFNIKKLTLLLIFWKSSWLRACRFYMMLYTLSHVKHMLLMNNTTTKAILRYKILLFTLVSYRVTGKSVFCFHSFHGSFICYFNIDNYYISYT